MIEGSAQPFPIAPPASPDPDNPAFSFETTDWLDPPVPTDANEATKSSPDSRQSMLAKY